MTRTNIQDEVAAIHEVVNSPEWKARRDATTLGAPERSSEFLANRLEKTLNDGIDIGRRLERQRIGELITEFIASK